MLVSDVFQNLAVGELSTLSVSDKELGTIGYEHHPRFIRYINDALTLIYAKFSHKIGYVNFQLVEDQSTYPLKPDLAPDLLKIISVQNLDYLTEDERYYALNDRGAAYQVRTTSYDTLYFPTIVPDQNVSVEYRANHTKIPLSDYMDVAINVHPLLETAVTTKVAAAAFLALGGEDATMKAQTLMQEFNAVMQLTELEDMADVTSMETSNKFSTFGWQ